MIFWRAFSPGSYAYFRKWESPNPPIKAGDSNLRHNWAMAARRLQAEQSGLSEDITVPRKLPPSSENVNRLVVWATGSIQRALAEQKNQLKHLFIWWKHRNAELMVFVLVIAQVKNELLAFFHPSKAFCEHAGRRTPLCSVLESDHFVGAHVLQNFHLFGVWRQWAEEPDWTA